VIILAVVALWLLAPPLSVSIKDLPRDPPVAFVADSQNKAQQCLPQTIYCFDNTYCDEGFTIDPRCAQLQSNLLVAADENDATATRLAIAQGANVNSPGITKDRSWWIRAIHPAAQRGHTEILRVLLDNGADVNHVNVCCFSSKTPLMEAVEGNSVEAVELLIARGANVNFRGIEDWTALRIAEQEGNERIINLLDYAGAMSWRHRAERRLAKLIGKDRKAHH
jgi:Ankyrin repeats (3 copies)